MIALETYRVAAWDTPLWVLPNRRASRYNEAGVGSTQYFALHPMAPWAEYIRNEEVTDPDEILDLRPPIWAIRVLLDDNPLELNFENAPSFGLAAEELVSDDHRPCQQLAARFRKDQNGPRTFIAPSAALAGTRNLIVLEPRVAIPYLLQPIDDQDLPTSLVAEDGHAPLGLDRRIHHKRSAKKHAGLEAWENGDDFEFEEPPTGYLRP